MGRCGNPHFEKLLQVKSIRERYETYAAKHPSPISFMSWLWFRKQGSKGASGGKLATNQSTAGKASARKRWGRKK